MHIATGVRVAADAPIADVVEVRKEFAAAPGLAVAALRGVSLRLDAGELVALVGRSGSGKTSLLHILGTLDRASSGSVCIVGEDIGSLDDEGIAALRAWSIGFVFQSFCLLDGLTAVENVATGLLYRGMSPQLRERLALAALDRVGMSHRLAHRPAELSGGERQRVAIARAIVGDRVLIIADEPTGNLDSATAGEVWRVLRSIADQGVAVIAATHDAVALEGIADRVVRLHDGLVQAEQNTRRPRLRRA